MQSQWCLCNRQHLLLSCVQNAQSRLWYWFAVNGDCYWQTVWCECHFCDQNYYYTTFV